MGALEKADPEIARAIEGEDNRQKNTLILIASENYVSQAVLDAQGSLLTNKYAEGYPGHRYYGGCEFVDIAERLAIDRAKALYSADHANVQPHSGSQANMAAYFALLNPGDTVLGMSLAHGGHLTHGYPINFSGKLYQFFSYGVRWEDELIDYEEMEKLAGQHRPKLIVAGASAYPRVIDFSRIRAIADSVGARVMVDMAHLAGLVAAKVHPSPVPHADIVTSSSHKTLRGPRGGFVLCCQELASSLDKAVFPGMQGGPLMHTIAAKAVAFKEAMSPQFAKYQKAVVANARLLGEELKKGGLRLVAGGTDNHLLLVDLTPSGLNGKEGEAALGEVGIVVNRNAIPFDPLPPNISSGIRLGTPAVTTRGFGAKEIRKVASLILEALSHRGEEKALNRVREEIARLCQSFPLPTHLLPQSETPHG